MTSTTDTDLPVPPAVRQWLENRDARDLTRHLIAATDTGELSATAATRIALAAGIGLTPDVLGDALALMDQLDDPRGQLDREEYDRGPVTGSRDQALADITGAAQQDLDSLVADLARFTVPTSTCAAVLAVVRLLTGSNQ